VLVARAPPLVALNSIRNLEVEREKDWRYRCVPGRAVLNGVEVTGSPFDPDICILH